MEDDVDGDYSGLDDHFLKSDVDFSAVFFVKLGSPKIKTMKMIFYN